MRNGIIGVLIGAMLASAATVLGQTPMRLAKVGPVAATASDAIGAGTTPYTFLQTSAAVLTAQIKGSPGMAWDVECWNTDTAPAYIRLYDQTGAPAAGDTGNIKWRSVIPPNTSGFLAAFPNARTFAVGIGIRVTGGVADNNATALVANTVGCNLGFN